MLDFIANAVVYIIAFSPVILAGTVIVCEILDQEEAGN